MLQCVAVRCSSLQCVAVCYSVLQSGGVRYRFWPFEAPIVDEIICKRPPLVAGQLLSDEFAQICALLEYLRFCAWITVFLIALASPYMTHICQQPTRPPGTHSPSTLQAHKTGFRRSHITYESFVWSARDEFCHI